MWFSIGLFVSALLLYFFNYVIKPTSFPNPAEVASGFVGVAFIGMTLCIACVFLNIGYRKVLKRKTPYWWVALAIVSFILYAVYFLLFLLERADLLG